MLVISSVEIPDTLDKSRIIEFSLLASNENIPTGVPDLATFKAITKERIVFPISGRPDINDKHPFCKPPILLSNSLNPVLIFLELSNFFDKFLATQLLSLSFSMREVIASFDDLNSIEVSKLIFLCISMAIEFKKVYELNNFLSLYSFASSFIAGNILFNALCFFINSI